ncbi:MAG: hypothetical protein IJ403_00710 [Oscillospiraceae bacterium]|nr:hypothetical protein [Oscillospiraceae bacterium]
MNEINIEHLLARAAMLEKEYDYDEALRLYNRVLEVDPDNEVAYDRRRAIRSSTLHIVIEPNPHEKQVSYPHYIELDGNRIGSFYSRQQDVEIPLGKHRLEIWKVGMADSANPIQISFYDFVMSQPEQTVYLRYTNDKLLHFSDLAHEEGTLAEFKGGCYVATAIYGSYDCPQVWTLRRFRDNTLAESWYGRAFIHAYYAISPTLVKWFGHTEWFKTMWQGKLDRIVAKLQANGVESTPYEDKVW